jgi:hypothetical protein
MTRQRRSSSRLEVTLMMFGGSAAALLIALTAAQAGGWWCVLSVPAWGAAAYLTLRGSELLHARAESGEAP